MKKEGWTSKHTIIQIVTEDKPFLVDSIRIEVNQLGYDIFYSLHIGDVKVIRDLHGQLQEVLPLNAEDADRQVEALVYLEIDKVSENDTLRTITTKLESVINQVNVVVKDWSAMRAKMESCLQSLEKQAPGYDPQDVSESKDFLRWLIQDHLLFRLS
ncbi:NAD-glutamate dehydrogenase domain-containing protein [Rickettsiella massiliensis]|uniref:NAD-glutamate dehydrogenase domain-containing protein n=1 Tax=Rickettsiella massiliensis TaxID=676517 RepID=UPI0002E04A1A|nr:NAD-glutamate dehydrogenase domain-containing protein [Rickettsiella massiliensis]